MASRKPAPQKKAAPRPGLDAPACVRCGNEIPEKALRCPFCDQFHAGEPRPARARPGIITVNLENGYPTVDQAMDRLKARIADARRDKVRLIHIVHGWGSSGCGGKIKTASRKYLGNQVKKGALKSLTLGEEFSTDTNAGRELMARFPELKKTGRKDFGNCGVAFVEL